MTAATTDTTVCFIYGIVPAGTELEPGLSGVGDPPETVSPVPCGQVAALVSRAPAEQWPSNDRDRQAHARVLDTAARCGPVLPVRFGAALADTDAVVGELLSPSHDEFRDALADLHGRTQYLVKGHYDPTTVLTELVAADPVADGLRETVRDAGPGHAHAERLKLGEFIAVALADLRTADTESLIARLSPLRAAVNVREPGGEYEAFRVAVLLDDDRREELATILEKLAEEWGRRVDLGLVGPMAPYDFVPDPHRHG